MSPRRSKRSLKRPRPRWRRKFRRSAGRRRTCHLVRVVRVALGDNRPAEGCERHVHGAGLVAVFSVADPHFALVDVFLRILKPGEKIALALLLDDGAKFDIATGAEFAGLEYLHGAVTARSLVQRNNDVVHLGRFG